MAQAKVVKGNVMMLRVALTLRTVTTVDGVRNETDEDFVPGADYPVTARFMSQARCKELPVVMDGNVACIEDKGTLPLGEWSLEIVCRSSDGKPMRFKQRSAVVVVDYTSCAGIEAGVEFNSEVHYLNAVVTQVGQVAPGEYYTKGEVDGMIADASLFVVPVTSSGSGFTSQVTLEEVLAAIAAGRSVIAILDGLTVYHLWLYNDSLAIFDFVSFEEQMQSLLYVDNEGWSEVAHVNESGGGTINATYDSVHQRIIFPEGSAVVVNERLIILQ